MNAYAELQVTTNFSFLRGASHPDELFAQAALLGLPALGITDLGSVAGIVRAWEAAKVTGVRLVTGCRLDLTDGMSLLLYPTDRPAYARLCRLLTLGKTRAGKGGCDLAWSDVIPASEGQIAILLADRAEASLRANLARLADQFGDRAYLALTPRRGQNDAVRLHELAELAQAARVATVATGDVLYHAPERHLLQDVVTCIREGCAIEDAGFRRERSVERHLLAPEEMARRLARFPDAVACSLEILDRCRFDLSDLRYQYPSEVQEPGVSPQQELERLTWEGATMRYGGTIPDDVGKQLRHELDLIAQLSYAPYFLTVNSIVRFARSKNILCQGRGSAANSVVCYVLGITSIDPVRTNLLFERFISTARNEPPDIDVDFEHDRREEVIQWVFETYGRDRAALCAVVIRYRTRAAVRDVGKVMGLTEDVIKALSSQVFGWSEEGLQEKDVRELNLNPADRRLALTIELARALYNFPRHFSQHPGGFVLTQDRLDELVPIEPASMEERQIVEWDKDDVAALRFMKVDVLALGMLSCLRRAFDALDDHRNLRLDMATVPPEDPATYAMIRKADTLGTFQIESRAQMAMLPRIKPRTFYDLVIEVAIVRPGPIQGDMVHPYLRRREGKEAVSFPKPELEAVLGKTLGVPLFQEQAMKVAIVCAGFTPSEADQLRRAMATFKHTGGVSHFKEKLISGMRANGYDQEYAERTFTQIEGFGSYGFPESHAASFALIAYASSWVKCHHPDVFCAAMLNSQPLGFYAEAQLIRDAKEHGVEIRPVDINASRWDSTLEPTDGKFFAVRLGMRLARGLANAGAAEIVAQRADQPYASVEELARRSRAPVSAIERLAEADAFRGIGLNRREAIWAVRGLADGTLPLFEAADRGTAPAPEVIEPHVPLVAMTEGSEVEEDYRSVGATLRRHPVAFLREELSELGMIRCADLKDMRDGQRTTVPGLVLVRQRPGSASGVIFMTIEDETAHANLVIWPKLFEKQRTLILTAGMVACRGKVQREGDVIHVIADYLIDLSEQLRSIGTRADAFPLRAGRGDGVKHSGGADSRERSGHPARDIYIPDLRPGSGIKVPSRDFR